MLTIRFSWLMLCVRIS